MKNTHSSAANKLGGFRFVVLVVFAIAVTTATADQVRGDVYLNEYRHAPIGAVDRVELYNACPDTADIGKWVIRAGNGDYVIPEGTKIPPNGYFIVDVGNIVLPIGDEIELIDDLDSFTGSALADRVRFGVVGGAPAQPRGTPVSLARTPDASAMPPRAAEEDELYWSLDFNPTMGDQNDVPPPDLGADVLINEFKIGGDMDQDRVELFNPLSFSVDVSNWRLTTAAGVVSLDGSIPPAGFSDFDSPGTNLDAVRRVDLFDASGVRIDQVSWFGAPPNPCFGRCPDGEGPSNGYDFFTCGGGSTWFRTICTLGGSNMTVNGECETSGVEDPFEEEGDPLIESRTWGGIKRQFTR